MRPIRSALSIICVLALAPNHAAAQVPCAEFDINGDGIIIPNDFAPALILCIQFGDAGDPLACDINGDGVSGPADFAFYIANFDHCAAFNLETKTTLPIFTSENRLQAVDISDADDLSAGYREYEIRFQLPSADAEVVSVVESSFGCDGSGPPCFIDPQNSSQYPLSAAEVASQGVTADTYITIGDRTGDTDPFGPVATIDAGLFDAGESIQSGVLGGWWIFPTFGAGPQVHPGLGSADGNINNTVVIAGIVQTAERLTGSFDVAYTTPDGEMYINRSSITTLLCPADANGDGMLNPSDFNAWILAFNNQAPACDQNADTQCLPNDFPAWVLNYNAGCP